MYWNDHKLINVEAAWMHDTVTVPFCFWLKNIPLGGQRTTIILNNVPVKLENEENIICTYLKLN